MRGRSKLANLGLAWLPALRSGYALSAVLPTIQTLASRPLRGIAAEEWPGDRV